MEESYLKELFSDDPQMLALLLDGGGQADEGAVQQPLEEAPAQESEDIFSSHLLPENNNTEKEEFLFSAAKIQEGKPKKPRRRVWGVLGNLLFFTLCIAIVGGAVLFAFSSNPQKSIFGYRFYTVLSTSMTPSEDSPPGGFYEGDIIIVKLIKDPKEIEVGDIITFVPGRDSKAYLTHRVVEIKSELQGRQGTYFVTRGDTNNSDDPPISADMVVGIKVFTIPKLGAAVKFMQENTLLSVVFVLSLFGLMVVLRLFFKQRKKAKTIPLSGQIRY